LAFLYIPAIVYRLSRKCEGGIVDLLMVALAGFVASLVDGALGMGFGPTSSTILLSSGLSPAAASTTVNIAKVAVGLVAGVSHWRFRNIDRRLVLQLAIPGCLGGLIGVTVLANVDGDRLKPYLAILLTLVGLRILLRFSRPVTVTGADADAPLDPSVTVPRYNASGVEIAAAAGGVTNGLVGAWGPVVTPFLLHRGLPPRFAIGSVNTAEVAVAAVAAASLLASLGGSELDAAVVAAMLAGGIIAAPLAAWMIRFVEPQPLGLAVGALLLLTNARELANWQDLGASRWWVYALVVAFVGAAALRARRLNRRVPSP
jgi:uncharacterized membrane protein YfcA